MSKFSLFLSGALLLSAASGMPAIAQQDTNSALKPVEAKLSVFHVRKDANGNEVLSAADKAAPGEILQYQTAYRNSSNAAVKSLAATLPLPAGLAFVPGSARPANAQASVDGKTFASIPLKTMVRAPDGKLQEQLVPYSDYRALRWNVGDFPASEQLTVSARAQVNPVTVLVAPSVNLK